MSNLSVARVPSPNEKWVSWSHTLSWNLVFVFALGWPAVLVTRYIYWLMRPEVFATNPPSISGTASRPPASDFFMWAMSVEMICITLTWIIIYRMNADRLSMLPRERKYYGPAFVNASASLLGLVAGTFLVMLAVYPLGTERDMHMLASWGFYITQVLALLTELGLILWLRYLSSEWIGPAEERGIWFRKLIGAGIFVSSLFYLYLFLNYENALPADRYTIQVVYVATEYFLAFLLFAYPMMLFIEARRHFSEVVPTRKIK